MEYYSVIKKKEILPFATWIYLETTMLSEISHQKDKYCMVSLIWESSKKYTHIHTKIISGISLVIQWLRLSASTSGGPHSIPGQKIKIPHATAIKNYVTETENQVVVARGWRRGKYSDGGQEETRGKKAGHKVYKNDTAHGHKLTRTKGIQGSGQIQLPLDLSFSIHILVWKIPWTEEPGRLQSMGSQRLGEDWATEHLHVHL